MAELHFCWRGVMATVEMREQRENAAAFAALATGAESHCAPVPGVEQQKELDQFRGFRWIERGERQSAFGAHGTLSQTLPPFMLKRVPARAKCALTGDQVSRRCSVSRRWKCWLLQPRTGGGNRLPGLEMNRIPLT